MNISYAELTRGDTQSAINKIEFSFSCCCFSPSRNILKYNTNLFLGSAAKRPPLSVLLRLT